MGNTPSVLVGLGSERQIQERLRNCLERGLGDGAPSFYPLIEDINAYAARHMPVYYAGLPRERQDNFCSPALNFFLVWAIGRGIGSASACFTLTRLAVCYIYCCDYCHDFRDDYFRTLADTHLASLRASLGNAFEKRLMVLNRSFDVYWRHLEFLRRATAQAPVLLSAQALRQYVFLRSSNTRLYCLILRKTCGIDSDRFLRDIASSLYYNMIIDDIRNDLDDIEKDAASGDPNLFVMFARRDGGIGDPRNLAADEILRRGLVRHRKFFSDILADLASRTRALDDPHAIFPLLKRFFFEKFEGVLERIHE